MTTRAVTLTAVHRIEMGLVCDVERAISEEPASEIAAQCMLVVRP
jgi:hypothetical protein